MAESDVSSNGIPEAEYEIEEETPNLPVPVSQPPALVAQDYSPKPLVSAEEAVKRSKELQKLITANLRERVDWGIIPGVRKPSLFKPGAEKIAQWFGMSFTFPPDRVSKVEDWEHGFFAYTYTCVLLDRRTGVVISECEASANSKEKKWRNADSYSVVNTIQKMAQKRGLVGAVLLGCAMSEHFTQDVEDMDPEDLAPSGADGRAPFDLNGVTGFGKHAMLTWKKVCELDPDYVFWACGRKDGEGLRKLGKEAREALGAELDRLATPDEPEPEGSPPPETPSGSPDLLSDVLGWGKHKDLTWHEIIETDSGYIQTVFDGPWGRKRVPPGSALHDALREALETVQDVQSDPDPEAPPHQTASLLFVKACTDYKITNTEWETFAKVHPDLPDDVDSWTEEDYEKLMGIFQRKGVRVAIDRAMAKAQPKGDGIPDDKSSAARRLVIRCRESEVLHWEAHSQAVENAVNLEHPTLLESAVANMQQAYLDHLAQGGKPAGSQQEMGV